jgi:glycosyltransferase involved in cell wall biosynthesis
LGATSIFALLSPNLTKPGKAANILMDHGKKKVIHYVDDTKRSSLKGNQGDFSFSEHAMTHKSRLPLLPSSQIHSGPRRSLCMIVRNEEDNLGACLESAADLVDEIVVVDTGSTDRTRDIARRFGARVFDFPWVDNFAAARNESLRHATGDWIFWLDADDRIDAPSRRRLKRLFAKLGNENQVFMMTSVCLTESGIALPMELTYIRLFRNHPEMRWKYRVHEDILAAARVLGARIVRTQIAIQHSGYQDAALRMRKRKRDLRLLQLDYADDPDDPLTLLKLGAAYFNLGRAAKALPILQRSLERTLPDDPIACKVYSAIVECYRLLSRKQEALATCTVGRARYPRDAGLLSQEGPLREAAGDVAGAESCYLQLLRDRAPDHFSAVPAAALQYWTRYRLEALYAKQGRTADAEALWRPRRR